MTDNINNIKIVRLKTGVDIIASVIELEENIELLNPMVFIFKRTSAGTVMMLYPWLPAEVVEENISIIYTGDVLTMMNPKQKLIDYYENMVNIQLVKWLSNEKVMEGIDRALESSYLDEDELEEDDQLDEEELEEYQELKSNNLLH